MKIGGLREFIGRDLSKLAPSERKAALEGLNVQGLARKSGLFASYDQIRALTNSAVEIGCHTFDHVHCRTLDVISATAQIESCGRAIEKLSGREWEHSLIYVARSSMLRRPLGMQYSEKDINALS